MRLMLLYVRAIERSAQMFSYAKHQPCQDSEKGLQILSRAVSVSISLSDYFKNWESNVDTPSFII